MNRSYPSNQGELHFTPLDYMRVHVETGNFVPSDPEQLRSPFPELARQAMVATAGDTNQAAALMTSRGMGYIDAIHLIARVSSPVPGEQIAPLRTLDGAIARLMRDPGHSQSTAAIEVARGAGISYTEATVRMARLSSERVDELAGPEPAPAHEGARDYRRMSYPGPR